MAESPNIKAEDLVTYKVLSGGAEIKETYQVFSISVENALNRIPSAIIKLMDGDVAEKDFEASNSKDFIPGTEIEIKAGYEGEDDTIFKGVVISMRIAFDSLMGSVLEVNCRDKAILMTQARNNAFFLDSKDSDVLSQLIGNYNGLSADVKSTSVTHERLVQYDSTDWDFMMIRADVNGFFASINQGKVSLKPPNVSASPVLSLTYGVDLIEFEADLKALDQMPGVEAVSWDMSTQKITNQTASKPQTTSIGNITPDKLGSDLGTENETLRSSAIIDSNSLKSWADARILKSRLASLTGTAKFTGSSLVLPNTTVEISGVGDRFSGTALVSSVTQTISDGRWITEINFGIEDEWFASKPNINPIPASGLTPEVSGLMIAKVKKLDGDPANENRIQVTLPMMQDDGSAIWARLATYYATNKKGNFFIPEIGDEVILGFLNNDPNFPIILGSLYSSKSPPSYSLTADNFIKAIVTNSECKIEFDDDKKIITILTPGKNQIVISDEDKGITVKDENNNTMVTDPQGITIKDKNGNKIVMSSSGIEINSSSNIKVVAAADVKVSGLNITNAASVSMKSSGQASAEFSASGQTTIKGAMVMIN